MPVGADALEAQRQRNARLDYDEIKRLQGTVPVQTPHVVPITPERSLADAVEEWRNETETNRKRTTYLAYTKSSEYFLQFCTKATVPALYMPHEVKKVRQIYKVMQSDSGFHEGLTRCCRTCRGTAAC